MRCPKCGYNSFDHNLTCPKCRKDLSAIRRLLNLTMPAPGPVDFFQYAGQRQSYPQPFIETGELMGEIEPAMDIQVSPAAPYGQGGYGPDITSLPGQENEVLEEIFPDMAEDIEEITPMTMAPQPPPYPEIFPEAQPYDPGQTQYQSPPPYPPQTQSGGYSGAEEEIEIEIDDLVEEIAPAAPAGPHQAAMAQITTALTETGDLSQAPNHGAQPMADEPLEELMPSPDQTFGPQPYTLGGEEMIEEIAPASGEAAELPVLDAEFSTDEAALVDEFDLESPPDEFDLEAISEQGPLDIEPENLAESLETVAAPSQVPDLEEEMFGAVEPVFDNPPATQAGEEAVQDIVPPAAVPGVPATPTVPPDATMPASLPPRGSETDDFSSLVDDLNLEDLDEKL